MTKQEVKDLCEADGKLQWWAMVLFAEICEAVASDDAGHDAAVSMIARGKVTEFPRLVIARQLEKIKEQAAALRSERENFK